MFTSSLINKPYTYENRNLLELRNEIMSQFHLTFLDIIKGYRTKRTIKLNYDYIPTLTIEEKTSIEKIILEEIEKAKKELVDAYVKKENTLFNMFEKEYKEQNVCDSMSCKDFFLNRNEMLKKVKTSTEFRNKINAFHISLSNAASKYGRLYNSNELFETINNRIANEISPTLKIISIFDSSNEMPKEIDTMLVDSMNYENRTMRVGNYSKSCDLEVNDNRVIFTNIYKRIYLNIECIIEKTLEETKAKELFFESFKKALSNEIKVNDIIYTQQLEAMPITINIDSKTGKIFLIDGYKRLLYINNENMLNRNVAIKVFHDLETKDFLYLLYAANYWKMTLNDNNILFHDRGYMFALKTMFDVKESKETKEMNYTLLKCLQLYDNIQHREHFTEHVSHLLRNKNFFCSTKYLINDIKQMSVIEDFYQNSTYSSLIKKGLLNHIIALLGYARKCKNEIEQKEIDLKTLIEEIFNDKEKSKIFNKKNSLSSDTYVNNMFEKFEIDKWILEKINQYI